jgi:hypothetical protein
MAAAESRAEGPRRRAWGVGALIVLVSLGAALAVRSSRVPTERYVGTATCMSCHAEIATTYALTAHALTSSPASAETIHGDFTPGANVMHTANPDLHFRLESDGSRFTQTAVRRTSSDQVLTREAPMEIVIGSGRKGQTYLHWEGDELCQLPVSYWTEHRAWVNSPGYADGHANFDRPITQRCLECHATTVVPRAPPNNRYDRDSLVLGISCEKCHGPGGEHVDRYRSKSPPRTPAEAAIVNPARLSRDLQMNLCALCHAGEGLARTPPLTYRPGDVLAKHITFPRQAPDAPLDVHASQIQLLERSRCFQASPTMTCATCHDVHQPQRDLAAMAVSCMACHQTDHCGKFPSLGATIATGCVDCHMPLERTAQIVISGQGRGTLQPKVRNHRIAVYPETPSP